MAISPINFAKGIAGKAAGGAKALAGKAAGGVSTAGLYVKEGVKLAAKGAGNAVSSKIPQPVKDSFVGKAAKGVAKFVGKAVGFVTNGIAKAAEGVVTVAKAVVQTFAKK